MDDLTTAGGPTFINVQVHGNSSWKGGGMFVQNSNVTISSQLSIQMFPILMEAVFILIILLVKLLKLQL